MLSCLLCIFVGNFCYLMRGDSDKIHEVAAPEGGKTPFCIYPLSYIHSIIAPLHLHLHLDPLQGCCSKQIMSEIGMTIMFYLLLVLKA